MAEAVWVPESETKPAPMPLLLVQSFVNTWEGDTGSDLLAEPKSAGRWLADAGLLPAGSRVTEKDLVAARDVRESIRALLIGNGGGPVATARDLRALTSLAHSSRLHTTVASSGRVDLQPEQDKGRIALGKLLLIIRDAQRDGTWTRLKACHNADCRWAFYDRSHARRGAWCDMAVCGNRIKNRNLRSRSKRQAKAKDR